MSIAAEIERLGHPSQFVGGKRIVLAPSSTGMLIPGGVLSVMLDEDEDVEWQWTHYADGRSVVTGYRIVKKHGDFRI
jgi:hypothetical protein